MAKFMTTIAENMGVRNGYLVFFCLFDVSMFLIIFILSSLHLLTCVCIVQATSTPPEMDV
jgi:hypothetical protein